MMRVMALPLSTILLLSAVAFAKDCGCKANKTSLSAQASNLGAIVARVKISHKKSKLPKWNGAVKSWPSFMQEGEGSWYDGTPSFAHDHGYKFWVATPIGRNIAKGMCLKITSHADPNKSVAAYTADVGGFDSKPHRWIDMNMAVKRKLGNPGTMGVSIRQVDKRMCEAQS